MNDYQIFQFKLLLTICVCIIFIGNKIYRKCIFAALIAASWDWFRKFPLWVWYWYWSIKRSIYLIRGIKIPVLMIKSSYPDVPCIWIVSPRWFWNRVCCPLKTMVDIKFSYRITIYGSEKFSLIWWTFFWIRIPFINSICIESLRLRNHKSLA